MDFRLSQLLKNRYFIFYVLVSISAFIFHLIFPNHLLDTQEYIKYGNHFGQNWLDIPNLIERPLEPLRRTPLYPLLLRITDNHFILIGFFQLIAGLLIPVFLSDLLRSINRAKYFNIALIFLLTYPLQMMYIGFKMPELFSELFVMFFLWDVLANKMKYIGITLSILVLLKPIFILFLIIPFFARLLKLKTLNWLDFLPFVCVFLVSFYNYSQYRIFSYSSISTTNIYEYNRYLVLTKTTGISNTEKTYTLEYKKMESLNSNMKGLKSYMDSLNLETFKSNIILIGVFHIKGVLTSLVDPGRYDAMVFFNWKKSSGFLKLKSGFKDKGFAWYQWIYIVLFGLMNTLKLLVLSLGLFSAIKIKKYQLIMATALLYLAVLGPVGSARYILPIYPLLTLFFIEGWHKLLHRKKNEDFIIE